MMWKTYRHTESEGDYTIYKEAFNQATAEIRNSERCYEQKIAFNIKLDTKSFYAYVRSKQKVQDKVGPLEGSDGNIITEGFLMTENLSESLVRCLPGKILMHYQYQRLSSKGEIQIIQTTSCNPKNGS